MFRHRVNLVGANGQPGRELQVDSLLFSGGEVQVKVHAAERAGELAADARFVIRAHLDSPRAVMELLLLTDALRRLSANAQIALVCPYFPYARQDRVCAAGEALSVRVMADLINAQRYASVEIWDAHSDVTGALLERVNNRPALDFVRKLELFDGVPPPVLVAPDAGAMKKVAAIAKELGVEWVRADKSRDSRTGAITGTLVYSEAIGTRDFLIVDDICDGGRTFTALARVLRPLTHGRILLYVTHGIFSAGYEPLLQDIDLIFTANRLRDLPDHPRIRLI